MKNNRSFVYVAGALALFFITALLCRPPLPVDETRYLSVAWEMFLSKQYAVMSLNFQPYHHKPPMLFWAINLAWEIFGVSRAAAMLPVFLSAAGVLWLAGALAERVLPGQENARQRAWWVLLGSVPFLMYGSLIMFDTIVTLWVLACLVLFIDYARHGGWWRAGAAGLIIGLGVLTKGPVMYLYVLWPLALYYYWRGENDIMKPGRFYLSVFAAIVVSAVPVVLWLIPTLAQTNEHFAFWLVWNQTAGRITGNFSAAHVKPFYFYVLLLPVLFLPWIFFPALWTQIKNHAAAPAPALRFLASAFVPVFVSFSLIAGKQPHYLLPLLPFAAIAVIWLLREVNIYKLRLCALGITSLVIAGQGVAAFVFFPKYDLRDYAAIYNEHRDAKWAFNRKYHGELNFIARVDRPIEVIEKTEIVHWLRANPGSYAIVRYASEDEVDHLAPLYQREYKGKHMGVFTLKPHAAK